jgi:16S rRNA (adenine1518-N6/adenine1519-N6)-dimethyltransferase
VTLHSPQASPTATIATLKRWGLHTDKSLGQHFLIDDGVVGRILRLAEVQAGERVLEVGPGVGTLTEALLLCGAQVLAVEADERLAPVLNELQRRYPTDFRWLHADALALRVADLREGEGSEEGGVEKLVANLPYAVAATIVLEYFRRFSFLQSLTVMVQTEVAARMAARPGSRDYGSYSVKLQLLACPGESFTVSPRSFLPPPRVSSTVIRLDRRSEVEQRELLGIQPKRRGEAQPEELSGEELPGKELLAAAAVLADAAFAERRKTVRNSMRSYFSTRQQDPATVDVLLEAAGIDPSRRGETLGVRDYLSLAGYWLAHR